jgi:hypothetical protein
MTAMDKPFVVDTTPKPRVYLERIGDTQLELQEAQLDVFDDVTLWHENPRLLPLLPVGGFASEQDLESKLRMTSGYDNLRKSIEQIGQMEPIYVWRPDASAKYVVFEGATRLVILRELARKYESGPNAGKFIQVKAKVLPAHFGEKERVILLARIHVRGTGVRAWGRYIEAKFIYDHVVGKKSGEKPLMSVTEMANHMEKSVSWVQRLRDAYQFALQFVHYVDDPSGEQLAVREFSTLEEISKAQIIGPWLRDYDNQTHDKLRGEVFDMVRNGVFKEYRDARFLKQFYDDPEKWALLKHGEKDVASRLAAEVKHGGASLKAKISGLEQAIERALQQDDPGLDEDDIDHLRGAISRIQKHVHRGVRRFRLELKSATKLLSEATLADVKELPPDELGQLREAIGYFDMLVEKYGKAA